MINRLLTAACTVAALLSGAPLLAETIAEIYQAALMAEKGAGDLQKAIGLYESVVDQHDPDKGEQRLAARARLRIGICQEKLGLYKAREVYTQIPEQFPDQPRAVVAAAQRIQSTHQREMQLDTETQEPVTTVAHPEPSTGPHEQVANLGQLQRRMLNMAQTAWTTISGQPFPTESQYASYAFARPRIPHPHQSVADVPMQWKFLPDLNPVDPQKGEEYSNMGFDDSAWSEIMIGQAWEDQGYSDYDAGGWYRAEIEVDARDDDKPVHMAFGGIDLHGYVYINGQFVGEHHIWNAPFILDVTDAVQRKGVNAVAIYVYDGAGMGGIYGLIDIHQPDTRRDASEFAINRADRPFTLYGGFPTTEVMYASYANTPPVIPYPHESVAKIPRRWKFSLGHSNWWPNHSSPGVTQRWTEINLDLLDTRHWAEIQIGQAWEDQGYKDYDGIAWYYTTIRINAKDDDKPLYMAFGGIAARDAYVYINDKLVGERHGGWDEPFIFDIGEAADYHGKNVIAIRVYDDYGMGGIYGTVNIHQPRGDEDVNHFIANNGGTLAGMGRNTRSSWRGSGTRSSSARKTKPYASYAFTQPLIPYFRRTVADMPLKWKFRIAAGGSSQRRNIDYIQKSFDTSGWAEIEIGQAWEDQGYRNYNGGAWYQARFTIDDDAEEAPIYMAFGGVDEDGYVYINGKLIGEHHVWDRPFILDITDAVDRSGENTIAIYVYDSAGMGGIYGLVDIHQPSVEIDASRYLANRGGNLAELPGRNGEKKFLFWNRRPRGQYASYAFTRPRIAYPYRTVAELPAKWKFTLDNGAPTSEQYREYPKVGFDDSHWDEIEIGRAWEDQGYAGYDEGAWYRAEVQVDARYDDRPIYMAFGGADKDAWVYVNGQLVGEHHAWDRPFILDISEAADYHGKNTIAIRVYDGANMGGIYGLIDIHQSLADVDLSQN